MATVVNNPAPSSGGNSFLIGVLVLVGLVAVLLYFGIPALERNNPTEINVPAPEVNVPEQMDINVNQE
jgi:hypothetical protein